MANIRVANLPTSRDAEVLEKQLNDQELERRREVLGVGLDPTSNSNFIEFKSKLSAHKLNRLRVQVVPPKARKDEDAFKKFIMPLIVDGELLERPVVLLDDKEVEVVVLRIVPIEEIVLRLPAPKDSGPRTVAMEFRKAKAKVHNRGVPPDSFLQELVEWGRGAADRIFADRPPPQNETDVYDSVEATLGPYLDATHRKACMLEIMRVLAGFESSWDWTEGRDITNPTSNTAVTTEAGAFQVSANSLFFGQDLKDLVRREAGNLGGLTFQKEMKANHPLAMEYIARLLRHTIRHNGPVKRHEIDRFLSKAAVTEFKKLLSP